MVDFQQQILLHIGGIAANATGEIVPLLDIVSQANRHHSPLLLHEGIRRQLAFEQPDQFKAPPGFL